MSAFLGPIHQMMFNKIKIAADRANSVVAVFKGKLGEKADKVIKDALPDGLVDFGDDKLEDILGSNPIHQFLQGLIDKVEVTEATLVTALLYGFPDESRDMLSKAFRDHGGKIANKEDGLGTDLSSISNAINQIYLEGMPCDQVSSYNMVKDNKMEICHSECLHRSKWEAAGAPVDVMCDLLNEWIKGFALALNPKLNVERIDSIVKGADSCNTVITL